MPSFTAAKTFEKVKGGAKKSRGCATNGIENPLCYVHGSVKSLKSGRERERERERER